MLRQKPCGYLTRSIVGRRLLRFDELGQSEVQNLGVAVASDHYVVWLEVSVHNACRVRLRQTFGRLPEIFQQLWQRSLVANLLAERLAIHKFHRNEIHAIVLANLVDVRDVRMIERRGSLGFLGESTHAILI